MYGPSQLPGSTVARSVNSPPRRQPSTENESRATAGKSTRTTALSTRQPAHSEPARFAVRRDWVAGFDGVSTR